jgi:flavorubredoxin
LATEVIDAAAIAAGSPTLNKSLMPKMAEALTYLRGLSPEGKVGVAFGSYGWAKNGGQHAVQEYLEQMKVTLVRDEPIQAQYVPTEEVLEECRKAGRELAEKALSMAVEAE